MSVDYKIARQKAENLKRSGFGVNINMITYNLVILEKMDIEELTQIVAISFFRSKSEEKGFYQILSDEIRRTGVYKNRNNLTVNFDVSDFRQERKYLQLDNLYQVIGFDLFYKYLEIKNPRSTVQKWCWRVFAKRKNEERLSIKLKKEIEKILKTGGQIRFSESSSSVYILNNESKIRISNHEAGENKDFTKTIIVCN